LAFFFMIEMPGMVAAFSARLAGRAPRRVGGAGSQLRQEKIKEK
jgi:hypothetical protein